jgi:hypothetical protein
MAYKMMYHPQYVMGTYFVLFCAHPVDSEDYTWHHYTPELKKKLEQHQYYSPSAFAKSPTPSFLLPDYNPNNDFSDEESEEEYMFYPRMPGSLTRKEIDEQFDVGNMRITANGFFYIASQTNLWDRSDGKAFTARKVRFEELVANIGVDMAKEIVLDLDPWKS